MLVMLTVFWRGRDGTR